VPRIAVELPLGELKPSTYRASIADGRPRTDTIPDGGLQLVQRDNATAEIGGAARAAAARRMDRARRARADVGVAARWFWQEYPAELRRAPRRRLVQPVGAAGRSRQRRRRRREDARVRDLDRAPGPAAGRRRAALTAPLLGVVDPQAVAASGALADALARASPACASSAKPPRGPGAT
jgi:hypothetical protein